ncbi:MAG: penicillin-binding protein [Candidatus Korobacteraceae bacterium]
MPSSSSSASSANRRLYVLGAVLFLWCAVIALRLIHLQVVTYGQWLQRAQRQQQRTIEVAPRRGIIYDRNGRELAMSISVDSVFAVPTEIPDPETTATLLARVLKADAREMLAKLDSSRTFTWVARKVDAETSQRIRDLNLRGIYFQKESKRFYPKRELAAQVLGWVGMDDEGMGGLEHVYEDRLRGSPGAMYVTMDARRKWFGRVERQPEPGQNVVLTVDEKIQYIAERELEVAMKDTQAKAGTVVIQNPKTGEILALVNRPTYNPNNFRSIPREALKNRAVSDIYEPGSTFKVVTMSGALEEKITNPDEVIDCQNGSIYVNGLRIRDHHAYGLLPVTMVLANSSGVGTIKLGLRLGEQRLDHYIRAFNFGKATGIELPGESRGLKRPLERWSKVSIGALSMGQEIGVTPLQLVSMISSIANDGVWTAPRIVAGFTEPAETPQRVSFTPGEQHRVVSTMTAAQMKRMLEAVVLFGTGKKAILDGYTSAGKTGTAQKIDPTTGAYSRSDYIASFAGFAPVNEPAVSVLVILDSARGLHQGGQIAAPVFARITQQVLAYLNVQHDAEVRDKKRELLRAAAKDSELEDGSPDRLGDELELAQLREAGLPAIAGETSAHAAATDVAASSSLGTEPLKLEASSKASGERDGILSFGNDPQKPPEAAALHPGVPGAVVLEFGEGAVVPSLIGKPLRSAIVKAQEAGFEIEAIGSGVAREQFPPAGAKLPLGGRVSVRFSR